MNLKKAIGWFLTFLFLNVLILQGQETFVNTYQTSEGQSFAFGAVASDSGNFLIGGLQFKNSPTRSEREFRLLKIDSTGKEVWDRRYANPGFIRADDLLFISFTQSGMCPAPNGGAVMAGAYQQDTFQIPDGYLLRVNAQGDSLWHYRLTEGDTTQYFGVEQTSDSGFVAVGYGRSGMFTVYPIITKVDKHGNQEWNRFLTNDTGSFYSVTKAHDGGYVMTGIRWVEKDAYCNVVKVSESGQVDWKRTIGAPEMVEKGQKIIRNYDQGYIIVGNLYGDGNGTKNWFLEVDSSGRYLLDNRFDNTSDDWTRGITKTGEGDYIYAGHDLNSVSKLSYSRLNLTGHKVWAHEFSDELGNLSPVDVIKAGEDRYLTIGFGTEANPGEVNRFAYAIMFDGEGHYSNASQPLKKKERKYKLYPNPFRDQIHVEQVNGKSRNSHQLTLVNSKGQVVKDEQLQQPKIHVNELNPGIYFYRITNKEGNLIQKGKLVKTNH